MFLRIQFSSFMNSSSALIEILFLASIDYNTIHIEILKNTQVVNRANMHIEVIIEVQENLAAAEIATITLGFFRKLITRATSPIFLLN